MLKDSGSKDGNFDTKKIVEMTSAATETARQLAQIKRDRKEKALKRITQCDTNLKASDPDMNKTSRLIWEQGVDFFNQGCIDHNGVVDDSCNCQRLSKGCFTIKVPALSEFSRHTHTKGDWFDKEKFAKWKADSRSERLKGVFKPTSPIFKSTFKVKFNKTFSHDVKNINQMMRGELDSSLTDIKPEEYVKNASERLIQTNQHLNVPVATFKGSDRYQIK